MRTKPQNMYLLHYSIVIQLNKETINTPKLNPKNSSTKTE